jgi:hypothetical protein
MVIDRDINTLYPEVLNMASLMPAKLIIGKYVDSGNTYTSIMPIQPDWVDILRWANEIFGPPGDIHSDKLDRWYISAGNFYFANEEDANMFVLRWSS